jgi:hypothetical protein
MNLKPNQAALLREYGKVLHKQVEQKKITTPTPTRIVGKTGKQLWTDYCMLVTPLKGKAK